MKNKFICLLIINELCGTATKKPKNTGHRGAQCLEGVMEKVALGKSGFRFDTVATFKDKTVWREEIAAKNIVPLFDAYVVTPANTEATSYTTGNFNYETAPAVKITTFESYLGFCSHAALKSYAGTEYDQVFEFNNDGSLVGVYVDGGKVKGQNLKDLNVGIRSIATSDKPSTTVVRLTYADYNELEDNAVVVKPDWTHNDLGGIFDIELTQVSATSTEIKFKALWDCGTAVVTNLVAADVVVKDAAGVVQTVSFVVADANGVMTVTGTGFATGYTLEIDGVIIQTEIIYEGVAPLVITVTP